jgi:hypothetical protein
VVHLRYLTNALLKRCGMCPSSPEATGRAGLARDCASTSVDEEHP